MYADECGVVWPFLFDSRNKVGISAPKNLDTLRADSSLLSLRSDAVEPPLLSAFPLRRRLMMSSNEAADLLSSGVAQNDNRPGLVNFGGFDA
jgi:hypothetical protein